jgi:F-type H+-transporting ATPase subunit b
MMAEQTAHTSTAVPGGHEHAFPPFDKQTFPSQLLWLALTFAALYLIMARIALPRVASILETRSKRIADDLAQAQHLKGESDEQLAIHEKALADAHARGQTVVSEARRQQVADADARRKSLDAALAARIGEAEKIIAGKKSAAMANVGDIAADAATAIIERLIGTTPAKEEVASAVTSALKR